MNNSLKPCIRLGIRALIITLWLPGPSAWSAEAARATVTISGSVMKPTCKINSGGKIDVSFGNVDISRIAAGHYKKPIGLDIKCGAQDTSILLTMKGAAGFTTDVVKASVSSLGIKILRVRTGEAWKPNSSVKSHTSYNNSIEAELVVQPGTKLPAGGFTSTITISADYN